MIKVEWFNETYMKVICEPDVAEGLKDYFSFRPPGYQYDKRFKNRVWDGYIRIFSPWKRVLYVGLLGYLLKYAKDRNIEVEFDDPTKFSEDEYSLVEANTFVEDVIKTANITLEKKDYQVETFMAGVRKRRGLFVSPTASGKSFIIWLLISYFNQKTLVIAPNTNLVNQLAGDFADYGCDPEDIHRIYAGKDKDTNKHITVSTWQSIYKRSAEWFAQFGTVIVDEAHKATAKSLVGIMEKCTECKYRFGLTGTLDDSECHELVLQGIFGEKRQVITTKELIDQGHLSNLFIKCLVLQYPDEIRKLASKLEWDKEIEFLIQKRSRLKLIRNLALSLKGNTILLFTRIDQHGKVLFEDISANATEGRKVFFIHGGVDGKERDEIRPIIEQETDAIICASYGTYSEGVNIKNVSNIIFASPYKSQIKVLQSIGRGLRKLEGKDRCTLFDLADDLSWKSTKNTTLKHFKSRIDIYDKEQFDYKLYMIKIN